jgi:hypothetical protein
MLQPFKRPAKSSIRGRGYWSGSVMRLSCLKSPQGRQLPSALRTICRGDAQQLLERRMMPCFSSFAKAARAASCFSRSNRRKRAVTGRPLVMSWCSTSCVGGGRSPAGLRTSWKSTRRPLYAGGTVPTGQKRPPLLAAADRLSPPGAAGMTAIVRVSMSWPAAASTTSLKCLRKSMPIIAKLTSASKNIHLYCLFCLRGHEEGVRSPPPKTDEVVWSRKPLCHRENADE